MHNSAKRRCVEGKYTRARSITNHWKMIHIHHNSNKVGHSCLNVLICALHTQFNAYIWNSSGIVLFHYILKSYRIISCLFFKCFRAAVHIEIYLATMMTHEIDPNIWLVNPTSDQLQWTTTYFAVQYSGIHLLAVFYVKLIHRKWRLFR